MGEHALDLHATFRDHHDFVWRSLAQFGLASTEIDDALQDVFVIAYRRRADFDGRTAVRGWLYGIARNVALKHRERTARGLARTAPVEAAAAAASDDAVDLELARQEAAVLVERFLAVLDLDQRTVFVLAEIEGHSAPGSRPWSAATSTRCTHDCAWPGVGLHGCSSCAARTRGRDGIDEAA
ncbi:MAG: sigma-70 family RNA polymerase sigma factor [Deltaproteobacteria bacterium]|nr:sigma-70 family RNA polymerase sigma factor [Deltaproteobacteria bacterium]